MKLVTRADLETLPVGLYVIGVDSTPECRWFEEVYTFADRPERDVPALLFGRVRKPGKPKPIGVEAFHVREDGLEVIVAWGCLEPIRDKALT